MTTEEKLAAPGTPLTCPVVAILRGRELLVGLRHYTPDKWKSVSVWTVPGGRCDGNEPIGDTLRREVEEEIGVTDLVVTAYLGDAPGAKDGDVVCVFVGATAQEPRRMEPEKFSEWRWADVDAMPEPFINAEVLAMVRAHVAETR